jgi:hypothetical protein
MSKEALSVYDTLKIALEALETYHGYMEPLLTVFGGPRVPAEQSTTWKVEQAITAIKEALQSNEQVEPVACVAEVSTYDGYLKKEVVWNKRVDSFAVGTKFFAHPPVPTAQPDCTRSHPHEEMSKECELRTEIARLTNCLKRANAQAEHLEREWYLRGNEIERLTAQLKEPEQEPVACVINGKLLSYKNTPLPDECFLFAAPQPQPKEPEHEPVAITITGKLGNIYSFTGDYSLKKGDKVYTAPPQRTWVGLTDGQKLSLEIHGGKADVMLAELVEQWLKEKNT